MTLGLDRLSINRILSFWLCFFTAFHLMAMEQGDNRDQTRLVIKKSNVMVDVYKEKLKHIFKNKVPKAPQLNPQKVNGFLNSAFHMYDGRNDKAPFRSIILKNESVGVVNLYWDLKNLQNRSLFLLRGDEQNHLFGYITMATEFCQHDDFDSYDSRYEGTQAINWTHRLDSLQNVFKEKSAKYMKQKNIKTYFALAYSDFILAELQEYINQGVTIDEILIYDAVFEYEKNGNVTLYYDPDTFNLKDSNILFAASSAGGLAEKFEVHIKGVSDD